MPNEIAWTSKPDRQAWGLPSTRAFQLFHGDELKSFIAPWSFGDVKDLDHVAGFAPHGFSRLLKLSELREDVDNEKLQTDQWLVSRLELVSLLKFEEPAVYVSEFLPRMDRLAEAKTRPLGEFESRALQALREGEELVSEYSLNHIRMVGSLRALKQCQACHQVERGELLGAFSYDLWRDPPLREQATKPSREANVTAQPTAR